MTMPVPDRSNNLFIYGTLMFEDVFRRITGMSLPLHDARLEGYRRYAIAEGGGWLPYPAIIEEEGASVQGKLIRAVPAALITLLDDYEGIEEGLYERATARVRAAEEELEAEVYLAGSLIRSRLGGEWRPEEFEAGLADYLRRLGPA